MLILRIYIYIYIVSKKYFSFFKLELFRWNQPFIAARHTGHSPLSPTAAGEVGFDSLRRWNLSFRPERVFLFYRYDFYYLRFSLMWTGINRNFTSSTSQSKGNPYSMKRHEAINNFNPDSKQSTSQFDDQTFLKSLPSQAS